MASSRHVIRRVCRDEALTSEPNTIATYDVDWTLLLDDTDQASLSSTCKAWRALSTSPRLCELLDLRAHKCDSTLALSLASRCVNLQKWWFYGIGIVDAIINFNAHNLRDISGDYCRKLSDATLSLIVARHELLECLQLGPDFCERITNVQGDAIDALVKYCPNLTSVGFLDCLKVDEMVLSALNCTILEKELQMMEAKEFFMYKAFIDGHQDASNHIAKLPCTRKYSICLVNWGLIPQP
ncbi:hypothetical protein SAY87_015182 [Trapa incisa]|uniref:Uncharacterized protein n=1 Tax=Trapa incisa TaxID=236973 RepID=A0AAN7JDW3_9MYRT|nr:hypothetical protein SAY87_015182 [Trapa incisa]